MIKRMAGEHLEKEAPAWGWDKELPAQLISFAKVLAWADEENATPTTSLEFKKTSSHDTLGATWRNVGQVKINLGG